MENKTTSLPSNLEIKNHSINALSQYWQKKNSFISELPVDRKNVNIVPGTPLKLKSVVLPDWADNIGINKALLVPIEAIPVNYKGNESDLWQHVDWFLAIFLLLECWHERLWEDKFESIHSYSFRLKGWDDRAWDYAWVNRIGLFLMEWSAHINNKSSESIFGKLPSSNIKMTHDVDAIKKTWAIRIKQSIFIFFNGCRAFLNGHFIIAFKKFFKSIAFFFRHSDWMVFNKLLEEEKNANVSSTFHFYADLERKNFKKMLIDPGYKINSVAAKKILSNIIFDKHQIGLHPGFESWNNTKDLIKQKKALEDSSGINVLNVRQHWLRFSWKSTWSCQESAGFILDTTLMFNDRPGFRNSSVLKWNPWNQNENKPLNIYALPSILMDSHVYDYLQLGDTERKHEMNKWINECNMLGGQAAVLWHPHTLTKDYGWSNGFSELINLISFNRRDI